MTRNQALDKALKIAKRDTVEMFVVYEPGEGYCVANGFDMKTFFLGSDIIATAYSNGQFDNGLSNEFI